MASIGSRGLGLLLIVIATGPLVVTLASLVLAAITIGGAVSDLVHRAEPIVATIQRDVTPTVTRIQIGFSDLENETANIRDEVDKVMTDLRSIGSVKVAVGQFGSTPTARIRLPENDINLGALDILRPTPVSFTSTGQDDPRSVSDHGLILAFGFSDVEKGVKDLGSGADKGLEQGGKALENAVPKLTLRSGVIIDKDLPSFPIPPAPIDASLPALSQAFAPLSMDGPVGKAIAATQREMKSTLDRATKLKGSLSAVADVSMEVFRLIPYTIPLMLVTYVVIQFAVASLLLMCVCATLYICLRHPREALISFALSPLGFVFYCLRSVLIEATTRLFDRPPMMSRAEAVADLRRQVERLQADIAARKVSQVSVPQ